MGKQLLVYVIGMSMMISYAMLNLSKSSLDSQDSYTLSYGRAMARNIATAGANIGTQLCLADTAYSTNLIDRSFSGGMYRMYVAKNGDTTKITSIGRVSMRWYNTASYPPQWETEIVDTVEATLRRISFSKYGYFTDLETNGYMSPTSNSTSGGNLWWITGDSLYGPVHTNQRYNLTGRVYFHNKTTATSSPNLAAGAAPIFNGGYQWGITVPRPGSNLPKIETAATTGGKLFTSAATGSQDVGLQFNSSGSVRVKIPWNTGASKDTTYASINALAPNGVIAVKGIDARIWGEYNGKATVAALTGTAGGLKGNIWINGDIKAADNPVTNVNSDDMLGLVAERMAYVATVSSGISRNSSSQTHVQAAVYVQNGSFSVESPSTAGNCGRLNLYGGYTGKTSNWVGMFTTVAGVPTLTNGMIRSFKYDSRFGGSAPPHYPIADKRELIAWWEN